MIDQAVAIVTGGSGGIGRAIRRELRAAGFTTYSLDVVPQPGDDTCFVVDVTDEAEVIATVANIVATCGRVDVAVSAAGTFHEIPALEIDPAEWAATLRLHLGGTVALWRAVLPVMLAANRGHLIAISSDLALSGAPCSAAYAAAKGAVLGLMRSLGLELAATGVRANSVAPGPTDTPMIRPDEYYRTEAYLRTLPARRLVRPDEVARAVRFLVEDGDYYVGQVVSPNAGIVM